MKEAIGTTMVFNLIIIFVVVFIILYVGAMGYSKAFKVRNKIIDIIELHQGYTTSAQEEIENNLSDIGYQLNINKTCSERNNNQPLDNESKYHYCVYENTTSKGKYYGVMVFIHFDIPLIGGFIELPMYGETRIIFEKSEVIG